MKNNAASTVGAFICGGVMLLSMAWELAIVNALWGFWAAAVGFLLFPGLLALTPWYMLLAYGNYQLLAFSYGGFILGLIIFWVASIGETKPSTSSGQTDAIPASDSTLRDDGSMMEKSKEREYSMAADR